MATGTGSAGIFHRTAEDEEADVQQRLQNYDDELWKSWPNEGAVSCPPVHNRKALRICDEWC